MQVNCASKCKSVALIGLVNDVVGLKSFVNYDLYQKFSSFLFVAALVVFGLNSTLLAGDVYVATMTGIERSGCKKTIAISLAKIDGVKSIRIVKKVEGTHRLTVTTDGSVAISKARAAKAIKRAEHYKIQSWQKSSSS